MPAGEVDTDYFTLGLWVVSERPFGRQAIIHSRHISQIPGATGRESEQRRRGSMWGHMTRFIETFRSSESTSAPGRAGLIRPNEVHAEGGVMNRSSSASAMKGNAKW